MIYSGVGGQALRLAGNTTTTKKFLAQTGDGTNSAAPVWTTLSSGDIPGGGSGTAKVPVTKIVAPSNAVSTSRADLVLTGTGDAAAINALIAGLPSGAAEIRILEGDVTVETPIVLNRSNLTLSGLGPATRLRRGWNENASETGLVTIGDGTSTYSFITLKNLTVDGRADVYPLLSVNATTGDYTYIGSCNYGVIIKHKTNDITIDTCTVTATATQAILTANQSPNTATDWSNRITIRDCQIDRANGYPAESGGVVLKGGTDHLIEGNRIRESGLVINSPSTGGAYTPTQRVQILNNALDSADGSSALLIQGVTDLIVNGNTINSRDTPNFPVYGSVSTVGISWQNTTGTLSQNTVEATSDGIYLANSGEPVTLTGNTLTNCDFFANGLGSASFIGNILDGAGITIQFATGGIVAHNRIMTTHSADNGITVQNTNSDLVISGNLIEALSASSGNAIRIDPSGDTAHQTVLRGNTIRGSYATPIVDNSTTTIWDGQNDTTALRSQGKSLSFKGFGEALGKVWTSDSNGIGSWQSGTDNEAIGTMKVWPGVAGTYPGGGTWFNCDGTAKSRTTYATLWAIAQANFAANGSYAPFGPGDGSTTFNLPDTRDRVLIGAGSSYTLGQTTGATTASTGASNTGTGNAVLSSEPAHTHSEGTLAGATNGPSVFDGYTPPFTQSGTGTMSFAGTAHTHNVAIAGATGTAGAHTHTDSGHTHSTPSYTVSTIQPSLAVNHIIRAL
jgi:parallel beta-helix repeat protein